MGHDYPHDHTHEHWAHPGTFDERDQPRTRDFSRRSFTVGIGGPVGSGKTALLLALCRALRDTHSLGVVTNDIFTREDAEFLMRHQALMRGEEFSFEARKLRHIRRSRRRGLV